MSFLEPELEPIKRSLRNQARSLREEEPVIGKRFCGSFSKNISVLAQITF